MRITLYFINWNDSFYLPFIKKHYGSICQRIVMYDNHSTDGSQELARQLGFEVRMFGQPNVLNDQYYLDVKNHCWKEERGKSDYVIVCDADEFVTIDDLKGSAPKVMGYNMISDLTAIHEITDINTGFFDENYSKQAIFDPNRIEEINFVHGCHKNWIKGDISKEGNCRLLHYRMIGGVERMIEKHRTYRERMSEFNKKHKMGFHYNHSDEAKRNEWNYLQSKAEILW